MLLGPNGMLGQEVQKCLIERQWRYMPLTRQQVDLLTPDSLAYWLEKTSSSTVINCAAYTQVDKAEQDRESAFAINAKAPTQLAKICNQYRATFVHVSTDFVFNGTQQTPYLESTPTEPLGVYGESKLEGEQGVLQYSNSHLVVRTSWLYGVHGANFVKTMLKLAKDRSEIRVVCDQIGAPTWSNDLADAILRLIENKVCGLIHYSNAGQCSWYDFAKQTFEEANQRGALLHPVKVTPIVSEEYPTPAKRPSYSVLDGHRYETETHHTRPHWIDSLRRMLDELFEM